MHGKFSHNAMACIYTVDAVDRIEIVQIHYYDTASVNLGSESLDVDTTMRLD